MVHGIHIQQVREQAVSSVVPCTVHSNFQFPNHVEPLVFSNATLLVQAREMKVKLAELGDVRRAHLTRQADRMATEFEAQRELDSVCLVVDMDMFYAAVEIRSGGHPVKAPSVRGKCRCPLPLK